MVERKLWREKARALAGGGEGAGVLWWRGRDFQNKTPVVDSP